jgi:hypothetical protein
MASQSELRLARLIDEREIVRGKHESKLAEVEAREDKTLTALDGEQVKVYRERAADLDIEIRELSAEVDATNKSIEEAKAIRRAMAGTADGIDIEGDGVVYRTMAAYARDVILTSTGQRAAQIQTQFGDKEEMQRAAERLQMIKRAPTNTTSTTVAGLIPAQHIDQIYQVINASRNLVATAEKAELVRGQVTFPQVDTKPVVLVQNTEKTEGGTTGLAVSMVTATASTYLGGGDLSWQAVNWSTPNALDLWFRSRGGELRAEDGDGRGDGRVGVRVPEQHLVDGRGVADVRGADDRHRRRHRRGVGQLGPCREHGLHGTGHLRVPRRADVVGVHAVLGGRREQHRAAPDRRVAWPERRRDHRR